MHGLSDENDVLLAERVLAASMPIRESSSPSVSHRFSTMRASSGPKNVTPGLRWSCEMMTNNSAHNPLD
jgi:hypothetical protein